MKRPKGKRPHKALALHARKPSSPLGFQRCEVNPCELRIDHSTSSARLSRYCRTTASAKSWAIPTPHGGTARGELCRRSDHFVRRRQTPAPASKSLPINSVNELAEDNPVSPVVREESAAFWCLLRCLLGRTDMPLLEIIKAVTSVLPLRLDETRAMVQPRSLRGSL